MKKIHRVKFISGDGLVGYARIAFESPPSSFRRILSPTHPSFTHLLKEDAVPQLPQTRLYEFWICKGQTAIYKERV